jgi:UDP-N-acetylmuramate dehydrogenase
MIVNIERDIKKRIKGRVAYNEPVKNHTSFRIGGPADIWIEPKDVEDIKNCIQLSRNKDTPLFIIGRGTNLLVRDEGIRGMVIDMSTPLLKKIYADNREVNAASSVTIAELLNFCRDNELAGLEFLAGIPGTVGGAVTTNAGARHYNEKDNWCNIGDYIKEIKTIDYNGKINILDKSDLIFEYKSSNLKDCVLLEVKFLLTKAARENIINERGKFLRKKKETQELSLPSAGCIFKNPSDSRRSAGELIDECGLKGAKSGGAEISRKHANFIINAGNASSGDVISLMDVAKKKVKGKFGIEFSPEIKIV